MSARPSARAPKASTAAYYAPRTAANLNGPYTTTTAAPAAYGAYTSAQPAYGSYNPSAYSATAYGGGSGHGYYEPASSAAAQRSQSAGGYPATCAGYYPSGYPSGYATTSARYYGGPRTASVYSDFMEAPQDWGGVANVALAGAGMGAAAGLLGGAAVGTTRKYWQ